MAWNSNGPAGLLVFHVFPMSEKFVNQQFFFRMKIVSFRVGRAWSGVGVCAIYSFLTHPLFLDFPSRSDPFLERPGSRQAVGLFCLLVRLRPWRMHLLPVPPTPNTPAKSCPPLFSISTRRLLCLLVEMSISNFSSPFSVSKGN